MEAYYQELLVLGEDIYRAYMDYIIYGNTSNLSELLSKEEKIYDEIQASYDNVDIDLFIKPIEDGFDDEEYEDATVEYALTDESLDKFVRKRIINKLNLIFFLNEFQEGKKSIQKVINITGDVKTKEYYDAEPYVEGLLINYAYGVKYNNLAYMLNDLGYKKEAFGIVFMCPMVEATFVKNNYKLYEVGDADPSLLHDLHMFREYPDEIAADVMKDYSYEFLIYYINCKNHKYLDFASCMLLTLDYDDALGCNSNFYEMYSEGFINRKTFMKGQKLTNKINNSRIKNN